MGNKKVTLKVKSLAIVLLAMIFVPVIMMGCGTSQPKVSQDIIDGCNKWINVFDTHKKDNYSEVTSKEMDEYVSFVNDHKDKGTTEEKQVLDKLGEVMVAYSTDSSEVAKQGTPIAYDQQVKELKDMLQQYSNNK